MMISERFDTKKRFFFVILIILSLFCIGIVLEFYFQIQAFRYEYVRHDIANQVFKISPYLQIKPKPNESLHVNQWSLRGDSLDLSPDTYRIFVFGGSSTFSMPLAYEESYPKRLENILRARYPGIKIQVQNAACDWYGSMHTLIRYLFEIRYYNPNLILVLDGMNDIMRSFVPDLEGQPGESFQTDYSHFLGPLGNYAEGKELYFPFKHSLLGKRIAKCFKNPGWYIPHFFDSPEKVPVDLGKSEKVNRFKSLPVYNENLRLLVKNAKLFGHPIILMTQPTLYHENLLPHEEKTLYFAGTYMKENGRYPDLLSLIRGVKEYNDALILIGKDMGIPVIDLDSKIPKTLEYFFDDVHPTAAAAKIEAETIADHLIQSGVIDRWSEKMNSKAAA